MNTNQIKEILSNTLVYKKDVDFNVCSANEIFYIKVKKPAVFVVNTDTSNKPGSHWVCFYFPKSNYAEFFDSLGNSPDYYWNSFKNFLIANSSRYFYNTNRIQDYKSQLCGEYCIYYILERCQGVSFKHIINGFSQTFYDLNDYKISEYLKHVLDI
jgi:hypothetical protein